MSKIFSGSRTAKVDIMANLSANILREIVARTFNLDATKVILSGEIKADTTWLSNSCWSNQTTEYSYSVYSFCPQKGFHQLDVVNKTYNNNDGRATDTDARYANLGFALKAECPESIFLIVFEDCNAYDDNRSYKKVTLYKSPDWKKYFQQITDEDIVRWEQWLTEEETEHLEFESREDFIFNHFEFPVNG